MRHWKSSPEFCKMAVIEMQMHSLDEVHALPHWVTMVGLLKMREVQLH
jgi:hypothetical protein